MLFMFVHVYTVVAKLSTEIASLFCASDLQIKLNHLCLIRIHPTTGHGVNVT